MDSNYNKTNNVVLNQPFDIQSQNNYQINKANNIMMSSFPNVIEGEDFNLKINSTNQININSNYNNSNNKVNKDTNNKVVNNFQQDNQNFSYSPTKKDEIDNKVTLENTKLRTNNILQNTGLGSIYNPKAIVEPKDNKENIKEKVEEILNTDIDILLTTGGVSVGEYDFLKEVFEELEVKKIFWKAFIKPGKPCYFGIFEKGNKIKLIFGLPGNPVSSQVNFKVYIKENIQNLFGMEMPPQVKAELMNDLKKTDKKRHFMNGILKRENDKYFVSSKFTQSSGNMVELSKANCLIIIEEEYLNPRKGEIVKCIPM